MLGLLMCLTTLYPLGMLVKVSFIIYVACSYDSVSFCSFKTLFVFFKNLA